jgi:hypothetical protein
VSALRACRRDRFALLDRPQSSLYNARRGANIRFAAGAQVAQLVEHVTENHGVGGSIPPLGTIIPDQNQLIAVCGSAQCEQQISSWVTTWVTAVRF